ncbi:ciliary microtubule-associated protein 3 [Tiliqua scincoides]|uniref:ciliary microtubule-associated protein 3 n=1 Tax=Tiliqua scincoides TaxID=71010 RepID=UPI003461ACE6
MVEQLAGLLLPPPPLMACGGNAEGPAFHLQPVQEVMVMVAQDAKVDSHPARTLPATAKERRPLSVRLTALSPAAFLELRDASQLRPPSTPWQQPGYAPKRSRFSMLSGKRLLAWELTEAQKRNSFGSCQARKIFPFIQPPDRLGNEHVPIKGDPERGPGTYNHAERTTLLYSLIHKPESSKGYSMGARTASRFGLQSKHETPAPTAYQVIRIQELKHLSSHAVFSSNLPRFPAKIPDSELFPGPGTYDPYKMPHRHVTWPGKFGSPDWSLVPAIPKRTLRTELITDKEFRKYRNLVAYLSIYYSE